MRKIKKVVALVLTCALVLGVMGVSVYADTVYDVGTVAGEAPDEVINAFKAFGWKMIQKNDPPALAYGYSAEKKEVYIKNTNEEYVYLALGCFVDYHSNPYIVRFTSESSAWQALYNNAEEVAKFEKYVKPSLDVMALTDSDKQYFQSVFYAYCVEETKLRQYCPKVYAEMYNRVHNCMTEKTKKPSELP